MPDDQNPVTFIPDPPAASADPPITFVPDQQQAAPAAAAPAADDNDALADQIRKQEQEQLKQQRQQQENARKGPNVTRGVSDEDLIRSFGYDPALISKSPTYQAAKQHLGSGFPILAPKSGDDPLSKYILRWPVGAVGQGVLDTLLAVPQLASHISPAAGDKADAPYFDLLTKVADENYKQNIMRGQDPGWVNKAARTLAPMAIPIGGEAEGASMAYSALRAGLKGAALSAATQPVYTDPNDPNSFAKQKAMQTALGAGGGAAGAAAARGFTGAIGRVVSYFKTPLPGEAAAAMAADLEGAMKGSWGDLSDLQGVGDPRLAARAKAAGEAIAGAGSDPTKIEQAVIKLQNFRTAAKAGELYDEVGRLAGSTEVPVPSAIRTMQQLQKELSEVPQRDQNLPMINNIKGWIKAMQPQVVEPPEPPPDVLGNIRAYMEWKAANPPLTTPPGNTFPITQRFRSFLGDRIEDAMTPGGLVAPEDARILQRIKDAVDRDLQDFTHGANAPPGLTQAAEAANNYYRNFRTPFLDPRVSKAGTTELPDTILNMFVKGGDNADLAEKFYDVLTPKGRAAVQSQMFNHLIDGSVAPANKNIIGGVARDGSPQVDPKTFLANLDRFKKAYGVFFKGIDEKQLIGVEKLMRSAVQGQENMLPLGIAAGAAGIIGHAAGIPWGADIAGAGLGATTLKYLLNTEPGKRVAYAAFARDPATPAMAQLWGNLRRGVPYAAKALGLTAGSPNGPNKITVKPVKTFEPPAGFAGGGLALKARMRRNTIESLYPKR